MAPSCGCNDTALLAHRDAGGGAVHSIKSDCLKLPKIHRLYVRLVCRVAEEQYIALISLKGVSQLFKLQSSLGQLCKLTTKLPLRLRVQRSRKFVRQRELATRRKPLKGWCAKPCKRFALRRNFKSKPQSFERSNGWKRRDGQMSDEIVEFSERIER